MTKSILTIKKRVLMNSLLGLLILCLSIPAYSATYYTRKSGNWNDTFTWSTVSFEGAPAASVPGVGDNVIIDRYEVTLDANNVTVASVLLHNQQGFFGVDAILSVENGRKLTLSGDLNVGLNNNSKTVSLHLKDNLSEIEVFGNLTITRPADFFRNISYSFKLTDSSKMTVHGDYTINSLASGNYLYDHDLELEDNSEFICKSNVIFNFLDDGTHFNAISDNSHWQIDGDLTINAGGSAVCYFAVFSTLTVDGDFTINTTGTSEFTLNSGGRRAQHKLHVVGDLKVNHDNGKDFVLVIGNRSKVLVEGDLLVDWEGSSTNGKKFHFNTYSAARLDVIGSFLVNVNDPKPSSVQFDLVPTSSLSIGINNNLNTESLTFNLVSASKLILNSNDVFDFYIYGDLNINCLGTTDNSEVNIAGTFIEIGKDININNTSNTHELNINLSDFSFIMVGRNIDFTKVFSQNKGLISLTSNTQLLLEGNIVHRPAPNNFGALKVFDNSKIHFTGTQPQTIPGYHGGGTDFTELGNVVLNNTSINTPQFTVGSDAKMSSLEVKNNNEINIESNVSLTVQNSIKNQGVVQIQNNASLIQSAVGANTNSGNGTYHIKRSGKNQITGYNIWSSPISSANITSVFDGANPCDIFVFQGPTQTWNYDYTPGFSTTCAGNAVTFQAANVIASGNGIMDVGRGYFAPGNPNDTRVFIGSVNNGDVSIPINTTAIGNNPNWNDDDWNMIGNPYPSSINAIDFWTENAVNNERITDGIYYWDDSDPLTGANAISDYAYWNLAGGVNSSNSDKIPNGHISSGQGFWVYANANTNVTFNNSMRSNTNNQFFKSENSPENQNIWISLNTPSAHENNILVGFNSAATDSVDATYDAHKLEVNPNVYFASSLDSHEFVIQTLAPVILGKSKHIPLSLKSNENGIHLISAYRRANLPSTYVVYIHDIQQGVMHDLSTGDFSVNLDANTTYKNRFELIVNFQLNRNDGAVSDKDGGSNTLINSVHDIETNKIKMYQINEQMMLVNKTQVAGNLVVFTIDGKPVLEQKVLPNQEIQLSGWSNLFPGIYIISTRLGDDHTYNTKQVKM